MMRKNHVTNGTIHFARFKDIWIQLVFSTVFIHTCCGHLQLSHESIIKHVGDTFLVTCKDVSGRTVEWSGPKGPLGLKTEPRVAVASYGTSLYFNGLNVKDAGVYTCKAGEETKKFSLTVKTPLTFMDTSPVQTGREFTPVTLRCEVKGDDASDKPILSWSVDNKKLDDPRYKVIGDGLLITNVTRADNKMFVCQAMQPSTGDIREQKIQLKVEHQPVFKHPVYAKSEDAWGFIGGNVNLTCEVDAEPPPTFEWTWKKHKLQDERVLNVSSHKSVLQIRVKDASLFGNYMCKVKNTIGTLEKIFHLQQGIQPPPPDFVELRGANSDLLDIGIHPHKSAEKTPLSQKPIGYRVEYKSKQDKHWRYLDFETNEENSYILQGLHHDTEYQIKAATRNKAGLSTYTNTSTFRTLTSQADAAAAVVIDGPSRALIICATAVTLLTLFASTETTSLSPVSRHL